MIKNPPAKAGDKRDTGLIPGLGRSPEGGRGNLLQYSFLQNPIDRGVWRATMSQSVGHDYSDLACMHVVRRRDLFPKSVLSEEGDI